MVKRHLWQGQVLFSVFAPQSFVFQQWGIMFLFAAKREVDVTKLLRKTFTLILAQEIFVSMKKS